MWRGQFGLAWTLVAVGVSLLIISGFLWWNWVYRSPARVFNDMLANNFSASSVSKQISSGENSLLSQRIELQFAPHPATRWLTTMKEPNGTSVSTESVSTQQAAYVRYTNITTQQKAKNGKSYNFKSILNTWGKAGKNDTSLTDLFAQAVLDIQQAPFPPIGKVDTTHKSDLMQFYKNNNVFSVNFKDIQHKKIDGQAVYVYQVKVSLVSYAAWVQSFAKDMGLHDLDNINPDQYQGSAPVSIELAVDPASHHLVQASYPASKYSEDYSDWNRVVAIHMPTHSIPLSQLEGRLTNLQ